MVEQGAKRALDPLLRQIYLAPDDDAPRLVHADELITAGDPRGELIAVQCALARGADAPGIIRRDIELLQAHPEWTTRHGEWTRCYFERGFLERIRIRVNELLDHDEVVIDEPIRELSLDFPLEFWDDDDASHLAPHPLFTYLRELELWEAPATQVERLLDAKLSRLHRLVAFARETTTFAKLATIELSSLEELDLCCTARGQRTYESSAIDHLAGARNLPALRSLSLRQQIGDDVPCSCLEGLQRLAASPLYAGLTRISLARQAALGTDTVRALVSTELGPRELDLQGCDLDLEAVRAIVESPRAARLEALDLAMSYELAAPELLALLASRRLPALRSLAIPTPRDAPVPLDHLGVLDQLETLAVHGRVVVPPAGRCEEMRDLALYLDNEGIVSLAKLTLPRLEHLTLQHADGAGITDPATWATFGGATWLPRLRSLSLPTIDLESARAIDWPALAQLRYLRFSLIYNDALQHVVERLPPRLRELHAQGAAAPVRPRSGRPEPTYLPQVSGVVVRSNASGGGPRFAVRSERRDRPWWHFP